MLGILAAIGAAFSWTCACSMWRAQTKIFNSLQLNSIKNLIAVITFSPILFSLNWFSHLREISILFLSGLIGITIGDSLYIAALKRLGTRKTLSIEALSPIMANMLGTVLIGEILPLKAWVGTLIVTCSLIGITRQGINAKQKEFRIKNGFKSGIFYAFLSVSCAVLAAILSRIIFKTSNLSPFQTTEIRLCGSLIFLLPISRINLTYLWNEVTVENKLKLVFSSLLGTNIGILLQQTVFQMLPIGIGWTLLSISPLISLLFTKAEGEKINSISITLALTTILGVSIALV